MARISGIIAAVIMAVIIHETKGPWLTQQELFITDVMTIFGALGTGFVIYLLIVSKNPHNH